MERGYLFIQPGIKKVTLMLFGFIDLNPCHFMLTFAAQETRIKKGVAPL